MNGNRNLSELLERKTDRVVEFSNPGVLFNNKGGVGKTTLTFNIAHMMARLGKRVVVLDFDPQCNLTAMFLEDETLIELWREPEPVDGATVKHFASLAPFAHTARKPMFDLRQADGIGGGQIQAVAKCRDDFNKLAGRLLARLARPVGSPVEPPPEGAE